MTGDFSEEYAAAYDLLNAGKNYKEEVDFLLSVLRDPKCGIPEPMSVLDLGCGSGRHLTHFDSSIEKVGVDRSAGMLKAARSNEISNCQFFHSDVLSIDLHRKFDVVYSLFHVLSYQLSDESLVGFFRAIERHLTDRGIALVDFWHRSAWDNDPPIIRVTNKSSDSVEVVRVSQPEFDMLSGRIDIDMLIFARSMASSPRFEMFKERHSMRAYTLSELRFAAQISGLDIVQAGPWMQKDRPLVKTDWYGWLTLRKGVTS
jgi:SAM-dependent methyltransferase